MLIRSSVIIGELTDILFENCVNFCEAQAVANGYPTVSVQLVILPERP
jgi:hypothetical protein